MGSEGSTMKLMVAGGAGFIGSNFIRLVLRERPDWHVLNFDKLTYAGNLNNLRDVADNPRYEFMRGDICDFEAVRDAMSRGVTALVNFAAETHVDRSLAGADSFIETDVRGVYVLMEVAREHGLKRIVHISTDEVYGDVLEGCSVETDVLRPTNPYSASKAGGEMLALAYYSTYGLPVVITRGSNNYGPYQYPEKFIPLFITNAIADEPLPLYGDGRNVRDWIHVEDHCRGILLALEEGVPGEVYNIGGGNERMNVDVARRIVRALDKSPDLIRPVRDRVGHDRRYALDSSKLAALGWTPQIEFDAGLEATVRWYVDNEWWWRELKSGEYLEYYKSHYGEDRWMPGDT